jgi:serine/threonine-protein kinase
MGTVYKAVDETLQREVAIKSLNADLTDQEVLKRFRAEAMTLARLNHPNIATLFELTEHEGQLLMVMELVQGETFDKVAERESLSVARAVELCSHVLDALSHAHKAGIVHRDLKPANLMLADSGVVKVMDFGLARMQGTEHLTNDGFMIGTPAYMSPEQVAGTEVDGRADLYAMGVVFYRLLTGQLPFKADSGIAMAHKQMYDAPTPVRQLRTELPSVFEDLFIRALAKSPDDRFQSADEMKAALAMVCTMDTSEVTRTLMSLAPPHHSHPSMAVPQPSHSSIAVTSAVPAPVQSHSALPVPLTAKPVGPKRPVGAIAAYAAGVLVLAAIPASMFLWRSRTPEAPANGPSPTAVVAAPAAAAEAAPTPAPAPVVEPSASDSAGSSKPASAPAALPPSGNARVPKSVKTADAALPSAPAPPPEPAVPEPPPTASAPVTAALPSVTFSRLKFLGVQDGKARDRDAVLRLDGDSLHVLEGESTLQTAAYADVIGLYHSHSKEPQWATPDGTAVPVVKVGGKFSIFKGTPDWVTVRTKKSFIPLRVDNDLDLARVIAALEIRTGTRVVQTK